MFIHATTIIQTALWGTLLSAIVMAAEDQAVPEPPDLPDVVADDEAIEPEVTIIKREEGTIYEYRVNGRLYMVKIQPDNGPAYYMIDRDGDGEFDSRSTDPTNIAIPQWILMRW
ncbi:MAG: DUF2782 domain-containing protein [Candidatus Thiodiazotropha sp. (ex Epidulcina cf. delphinae)]|nr:DUF2782 domain-containing protein [Candidatus Thiodiazotropha sp. (ex Epidulcina cf. delphinae)]